jgi:hypothetical protein
MPTDITKTFGALYVGALIIAVLYGFGSLQTYIYFHLYGRDSIWQKMLVFYIWFLHSVQVILCTYRFIGSSIVSILAVCPIVGNAVFHYIIADYSNPEYLVYGYT